MESFLSAFIGFIIVTVLDRVWFDVDHKKIEKGYEVIEHYHLLTPLWIIAFIMFEYSSALSYGLLAMGATFFYRECRQKNYFAYHSNHFKNSTIIGIVGIVITIIAYVLVFVY